MMPTPAGWRSPALDEIADIRPGRTPRKLDRYLADHPRQDRKVPFFKVGDMNAHPSDLRHARTYLAQEELVGLGVSLLPVDSIVFPKAGGAIATNKKRRIVVPGVVDLNCMAVVPRESVDARYLRAWFESLDLTSIADGSVLPQISKRTVAALRIPLPELEEQRRIVDLVEDHLSRLAAGDRSLKTALRRASTLRTSIIDRAAQGSLDGAEAGQDGLAPGWTWVPPAAVSDDHKGIVIGPFGSNLKTSDYRTEGVPLVFVRNVRQGYFGPVGRRYVSFDKAAELSSHEVLQGDVVITKMGDPPGDAAVYDASEPAIVTADVIRLRPGSDQSSDYLALAINSSAVARQIAQITRGVAQKKVSLARFRAEVRIPVPDHETQVKVARQVADLTSGVGRVVRQSEAGQDRALSLRRSLLVCAFAGRLTGQAADMEMVEEMAGV